MVYIILLTALAAVGIFAGVYFSADTKSTDNIDGGVVKNYTDPLAPKEIMSKEITEFDAKISAISSADEELSGKVFSFKATVGAEKVSAKYSCRLRGRGVSDCSFEADKSFMKKLYTVVSKYDLAQYNGYYHHVSGLPDMYGANISVSFASGESIHAEDNQSCFVGNEALKELTVLFEKAANVKKEGTWSGISFSCTHMNWSHCFNVNILPDTEGNTVAEGFCIGPDGTEYRVEDYFVFSKEGLAKLRALKLDSLPKKKTGIEPIFKADDESVTRLVLSYPDGKDKEKALTNETTQRIFDIVLEEFIKNAGGR